MRQASPELNVIAVIGAARLFDTFLTGDDGPVTETSTAVKRSWMSQITRYRRSPMKYAGGLPLSWTMSQDVTVRRTWGTSGRSPRCRNWTVTGVKLTRRAPDVLDQDNEPISSWLRWPPVMA
jgi:hypothetical protein